MTANTKKLVNGLLLTGVTILVSCGSGTIDRDSAIQMLTMRTLGLGYLEESMMAEAKAEFEKLVELAPNEVLGHANLGLVYMRQTKYDEAERLFKKALEIEPEHADVRLNLAEVYELTHREADALEIMRSTIETSPGHIRTLYKLSQVYARSEDPDLRQQGEEYLKTVVDTWPANIVAKLQLVELSVRNNHFEQAKTYLQTIERQFPELPQESIGFYRRAIELMSAGRGEEALTPCIIFHNTMKVIPLFQKNTQDLKGSGGPLMGTPVESFSLEVRARIDEQDLVAETVRFNDMTAEFGLSLPSGVESGGKYPVIAGGDFDNDGDEDLYVSHWIADRSRNVIRFYRNDSSGFTPATQTGLKHTGEDVAARFADFDNDGYLDLLVLNTRANRLYQNKQGRFFQDVAGQAGIAGVTDCLGASFADFDHDGDLDLYLCRDGENRMYRNNSDSTFTEVAQRMQVAGAAVKSNQAVFGDFDDDGDLDLLVANENAGPVLYSNLRQGQFEDITGDAGLISMNNATSVSVADVNNDGNLDLQFIGDGIRLFQNTGESRFSEVSPPDTTLAAVKNLRVLKHRTIDFDNDGLMDLLLAGVPGQVGGTGIILLRNMAEGMLVPVPLVLPADLKSSKHILVSDVERDGDLDIIASEFDGKLRLLRNDGGNANGYLQLTFAGMRLGSSKNNYFGIGAKLEVRAADLYQVLVIEEPMTHLGLGPRSTAEALRVVWPNGVPQNAFYVESNQTLQEKQTLKGSCAFLYTWNGEAFEFVTDVMWRSALGMPLGIMGGETAYAFSNSSNDYFRIPGEKLRSKNGKYTIQVTEELWESAYLDQLQLIAIDHPDSVEVYIDERFIPPPAPDLTVQTVYQPHAPLAASDGNGRDVREVLVRKDDRYVGDFVPAKYQGITHLHDLILDLGEPASQNNVTLYLNGWIFPTDASINVALTQTENMQVIPPYLQVMDSNGQWRTVVKNVSFPMGKDKTVIVDLKGKFLTDDYRVRIRTNMELYWDHAFFTTDVPDIPLKQHRLTALSADLHFRGFSRLYRKGGRNGPHWFDYNSVNKEPMWLDLIGHYTRYGAVLSLLTESDDRYVIMNSADEITIEFDAVSVPPLPEGWRRDFVIYTDGWIKDGDLNTAHGKTIKPLPFHAMQSYPYDDSESYPNHDEALQMYHRDYNTRNVTTEALLNSLRQE